MVLATATTTVIKMVYKDGPNDQSNKNSSMQIRGGNSDDELELTVTMMMMMTETIMKTLNLYTPAGGVPMTKLLDL